MGCGVVWVIEFDVCVLDMFVVCLSLECDVMYIELIWGWASFVGVKECSVVRCCVFIW